MTKEYALTTFVAVGLGALILFAIMLVSPLLASVAGLLG